MVNKLDPYMEDPSQKNAENLQKLINKDFSKGIDEDKKVGGLTLKALESIAGIDSPDQTTPW